MAIVYSNDFMHKVAPTTFQEILSHVLYQQQHHKFIYLNIFPKMILFVLQTFNGNLLTLNQILMFSSSLFNT